jgi:hypothetical protein
VRTSQHIVSLPSHEAIAPTARLPVLLAWLAVLLLRGLALVLLLSPLVLATAWLLRGTAG